MSGRYLKIIATDTRGGTHDCGLIAISQIHKTLREKEGNPRKTNLPPWLFFTAYDQLNKLVGVGTRGGNGMTWRSVFLPRWL